MKGLRIVSILLMVGLFVVSIGLPGVMAGGTATASATATGGENCAETQKTRGTGGLTVVQVRVNGVALDKSKGEYTVDRDGGSQVTVHFTKALSGGAPGPPVVPPDNVEIDFSTGKQRDADREHYPEKMLEGHLERASSIQLRFCPGK